MAKIIDTADGSKNGPSCPISFEIFPPKGDLTLDEARKVARPLVDLNPHFISVTCSAGGSANGSGQATTDIAAMIAEEMGACTMAHLTCIGSTEQNMAQAIDYIEQKGVENVLALRGDLREGVGTGAYEYAKEIIPLLKERGLCVGAAAYPEGHVSCLDDSVNVAHLKQKQDAGADFFVTQLFFDNNAYYRFWDEALDAGITVPIYCGIMPFMSKSQIQRMVFMCGASLPAAVVKILGKYEHDEASMRKATVEYAVNQLSDLRSQGVDGLHLYTMNKPQVARAILELLG